MMLHPKTDEVRKSMFETLCHTLVALFVVTGATILVLHGNLDSASWAGACGTAIAASGAITVVRRSEVDRPTTPEERPERPLVVVDRRGNGHEDQ